MHTDSNCAVILCYCATKISVVPIKDQTPLYHNSAIWVVCCGQCKIVQKISVSAQQNIVKYRNGQHQLHLYLPSFKPLILRLSPFHKVRDSNFDICEPRVAQLVARTQGCVIFKRLATQSQVKYFDLSYTLQPLHTLPQNFCIKPENYQTM